MGSSGILDANLAQIGDGRQRLASVVNRKTFAGKSLMGSADDYKSRPFRVIDPEPSQISSDRGDRSVTRAASPSFLLAQSSCIADCNCKKYGTRSGSRDDASRHSVLASADWMVSFPSMEGLQSCSKT